MSKLIKKEIPNGALRLVASGAHAVVLSSSEEPNKKSLKMTVYSGKVIKDHFWWGDLAIDLAGISFRNQNIRFWRIMILPERSPSLENPL